MRKAAVEFRIPADFLAAVVDTERVYDTEWYDVFQNWHQPGLVGCVRTGVCPAVPVQTLAQMLLWELYWKPGAKGVGPGLGLAHVHTGPARELEDYFEARGLGHLLPKPTSMVER